MRKREAQSFYDDFSIQRLFPPPRAAPATRGTRHARHPPRAAPAARPRRAPKVNRLFRTLKLDSLTFFQMPQILRARFRCMTSFTSRGHIFLSGVSIVTSLNDTSAPCAREHLRSCLHLTNPCAKRKVLSLTKPKDEIPRSLYYIYAKIIKAGKKSGKNVKHFILLLHWGIRRLLGK